MPAFRFFWTTHKWTGIVLASFFVLISVTGFLLLLKKKVDWIQPPTQHGTPGPLASFLTVEEAIQHATDAGHPALQGPRDVDRIDLRPDRHVYKVRAVRDDLEVQVCATTGTVLSVAERRSDWLERLHDGSFFGEGVHGWVMPVVAVGLLFLVFSGLWLWIEPALRRRRKRRRHAAHRARAP